MSFDGAAWMDLGAATDEAEQPPVVRHLRFVIDEWGVSTCGADDGVLFSVLAAVNCEACIRHEIEGTRSVHPEEYREARRIDDE